MSSTLPVRRLSTAGLALLLVAAAMLLFAGVAGASTLTLAGGYTQLTTDPTTTKDLIGAKVLPVPIFPSWVVPTTVDGKLALKYRFYITGGAIDGQTLGGEIRHSGGLRFTNLANGKSLAVRSFTIDTVNSQLTAWIPALNARVAILDLDLSTAGVSQGSIYTRVGPVKASLNETAANALNGTLGTSVFKPGQTLGNATVFARFAQ
jgi:hypothetical protein